MNYVHVRFNNGHGYNRGMVYSYKNHCKDIKMGDFVVVSVRGVFKVAEVARVSNDHDRSANKFIVCKVNTSMWPEGVINQIKEDIAAEEKHILEKRKRTKGTILGNLYRELATCQGDLIVTQ